MPQIRNFDDAHKVLAKYVDHSKQVGSYKLERMQILMKQLGNPQDTYKIVHVAGTSGKTSTAYYISALLQASGQKVGLTVSPHVDEVNERVQINLTPLSEKAFCNQLSKFIDLVDAMDLQPTYFELLVAFAYWEFAQQKVDYAVVEVGLGGLLDGTNVFHNPNKICVITDIGLDHTSVLGHTIDAISAQKAGIIQDHNQAFIYKQKEEVMDAVVERCRQEHAVLHIINTLKKETDFKQRNFYLAKNVYDFIAKNENWPDLSSNQQAKAEKTNVPARMEIFKRQDKTIIIDGSHNGQKVAALTKAIEAHYKNQKAALLVSFVESEVDRAPASLAQLKHLTSKVIITSFTDTQDTPKKSVDSAKLAELAQQAKFTNVKIINDSKQAFEYLLEQPEDLLIVTGSFYLLNHIRPLLG